MWYIHSIPRLSHWYVRVWEFAQHMGKYVGVAGRFIQVWSRLMTSKNHTKFGWNWSRIVIGIVMTNRWMNYSKIGLLKYYKTCLWRMGQTFGVVVLPPLGVRDIKCIIAKLLFNLHFYQKFPSYKKCLIEVILILTKLVHRFGVHIMVTLILPNHQAHPCGWWGYAYDHFGIVIVHDSHKATQGPLVIDKI